MELQDDMARRASKNPDLLLFCTTTFEHGQLKRYDAAVGCEECTEEHERMVQTVLSRGFGLSGRKIRLRKAANGLDWHLKTKQ